MGFRVEVKVIVHRMFFLVKMLGRVKTSNKNGSIRQRYLFSEEVMEVSSSLSKL